MKHELMESAIREQFSDADWKLRTRHVTTLRNFAGASVAAANALAVIRDKKLYRPYTTLKEFCQRECGWTEQRLFQIITFAKVRAALPAKVQPLVESERQARELVRVPEEQREEVLNEAKKNGEITAKSIRKAASKIGQDAGGESKDDLGYGVPESALLFWSRRDEAKTVLECIKKAKREVKVLDVADPMWAEVNLNGVLGDLSNAINRFAAAVPAYVCPYCQGLRPTNCTTCKGRGVVSAYMWKLIPEELRNMREKQVK